MNDYVKNYIGDGKGPKNFAKEYVERRSKYRNSLKSVKNFEDDLLTPAAAINPNEPDEPVPVLGGGGASGKKNKKKNKSKSKLDASHLLGFSVAAADRPNAGELDFGQWEHNFWKNTRESSTILKKEKENYYYCKDEIFMMKKDLKMCQHFRGCYITTTTIKT